MKTVKVNLGKRSYRILIGNKITASLGRILKDMELGNAAVIITNPVIKGLFDLQLKNALQKQNIQVKFLTVPDSETSKSREIAFRVIDRIAQFDVQRKIFIVALGGGVVGDLAGFVASVYKRGVSYIQVPTTLLAQIDSSIGGKVAIDLTVGKNLVGAFYQPRLVFSDISFLKSLGRIEVRSGLAEAIKYGVILDKKLFTFIERNYKTLLSLNPKQLEQVVKRCSQLKAEIVGQDEKEEKGRRTILNFGHTIGHAVEAAVRYKGITHGEAIGFGMVCACEIADRLGLLDRISRGRIIKLIEKVGLPVRISHLNLAKVLNALSHDKKFIAGKNRFVLPVRIGKVIIRQGIPVSMIKQVLAQGLI